MDKLMEWYWEDFNNPVNVESFALSKDISMNIHNISNFDNFVNNINTLEKYNDFIKLKDKINNFILKIFDSKLEWKNSDFKKAFKFWNISLYSLDNERNSKNEYNELFKLLIEKNKFYLDIFSKILNSWKLNNILTEEEISDSNNIIKSWVLQEFDKIYFNWYQSSIEEQHQQKDEKWKQLIKTKDWNPIYWWLKNWSFVWYKEFNWENSLKINTDFLKNIKNPNLKWYLNSITTFIENWIKEYYAWVWIDELSLNTWHNRKSNLWLVTPIENYIQSALVEPELILFIKNLEQNNRFNLKEISDLSEKYFGKTYWMENVTLDVVDTFLEWGQSIVSGFIWKQFPNDEEQSKRLWNSILLKASDVTNSINHASEWFEKLLWYKMPDKNKIYDEVMKHLVYHEFWHVLYIKWNKKSLREEAKASLYYYLKLYDENNINWYDSEKIKLIIESALTMWLRDITRLSNPSAQKHVLRWKMILRNLLKSWLIKFNWDILEIIPDENNFKNFLDFNKADLENIKSNYLDNKKNKENSDEVVIKNVEDETSKTIEKMLKIINTDSTDKNTD